MHLVVTKLSIWWFLHTVRFLGQAAWRKARWRAPGKIKPLEFTICLWNYGTVRSAHMSLKIELCQHVWCPKKAPSCPQIQWWITDALRLFCCQWPRGCRWDQGNNEFHQVPGHFRQKTWLSLSGSWDLAIGGPCNRTTTTDIPQNQHRSGSVFQWPSWSPCLNPVENLWSTEDCP